MKTITINGKELKVHDQFEYYQPNTHVDGDCVIRALCKATGWGWKKAYCFAFTSTIHEQFMPNCKDGERILYKKLGYQWHAHNNRKARPSVLGFIEQHPAGTYVLSLSKHHVCVENGKYFDIWDSGNRKIYGYWEKPTPSNDENNPDFCKGDPSKK